MKIYLQNNRIPTQQLRPGCFGDSQACFLGVWGLTRCPTKCFAENYKPMFGCHTIVNKMICRELQTNDGKVDESDPDGDLLRVFFRSLPRVAGGVFKFQPGEMESIFGDTTCRFLRYQDSCSPKTHGFLKILGRYSHLQSP